jgi:2-polyprenyl-3-methyl-5-hydroxy-6-metoxy-1,4-benzoquinol methylase
VTGRQADPATASPEAGQFYHRYSVAEERERTNQHYDKPAEFFLPILGGRWQVYSCNLWDGVTTETESQEHKLDLLASLMGLAPGKRVLDVGCGWGGPLVYLSQTYGVQGVGITLSPSQRPTAEARIARHGVDARVLECHWRDFDDDAGFDAVYTDEAIVHFEDLRGYFEEVRSLLRPGGLMLNKGGGQAGLSTPSRPARPDTQGQPEVSDASPQTRALYSPSSGERTQRPSEGYTPLCDAVGGCGKRRREPLRRQMRPVSWAHMATSTRFRAPSFRMRLARWALTVLGVM